MSQSPIDRPRDSRAVQRVAAGYDRIARQYTASRSAHLPPLLVEFATALPDGVPVLDLGCGAGVPIGTWLAKRFAVAGVDLSRRQVELARRNIPSATLMQSDMVSLRFPPASFALVVVAYSIIHVPREAQAALVARIASWLRPGGGFLASWATAAWEGEEEDWEGWGAPMWWSHYGAETNLTLLRNAGLSVNEHDVVTVTGDGETWMWVLGHAPDGCV